MRTPAVLLVLGTMLTQQTAGDRPAGNPRGTRSVVMARNGAIATSQPLATAAGLKVLQSGGNAIDAAVTAAAVLSVVEPTMNGAGGDLFAIVYSAKDKKVHGLNASGRAPAAATIEEFKKRNVTRIPLRGELSVSVPGVVDGWSELVSKHGTRTLAQALEPAIKYARDGYAVSEIIADQWKSVESLLARDPNAASTFLINGKAPAAGEVFKNPKLAASLELIAKGGRDAFYKGVIAEAIADTMQRKDDQQRTKGLITAKDLADHRSDWVEPLVDDLPRLPGARAAAEHAGRRGARDAEHHGGLRPQGARPQLRRLPAPDGRGQAHRVRGPRRVAGRRRVDAGEGARTHAVEGVRGGAPQGNQRRQGGGRLQAALDRRPDHAGRAATTPSAGATRST